LNSTTSDVSNVVNIENTTIEQQQPSITLNDINETNTQIIFDVNSTLENSTIAAPQALFLQTEQAAYEFSFFNVFCLLLIASLGAAIYLRKRKNRQSEDDENNLNEYLLIKD
jgi:hypothetical protein